VTSTTPPPPGTAPPDPAVRRIFGPPVTQQPPASPPSSVGRQLEGLVRVTSPRRWLTLALGLVALAAAVLYSFFGGAPTQVPGTGFLLGPSGIDQVDTTTEGTVLSLTSSPGDQIRSGETVALVQPVSGGPLAVKSRVSGEVLLTLASPGDVVAAGTPLLEVLPADSDLQAQIFVSALQGSSVRPGMPVRVNPVTAPASQYGSVTGTVQSVSRAPLSSSAISSLLGGNDELAAVVDGRDAPLQVSVILTPDRDTPTGYHWTSGRGPSDPVLPTTVLTANVIVKQERPIDLLLDSGRRDGER